jgi:caffeoyl-CoA O-methyltransferase
MAEQAGRPRGDDGDSTQLTVTDSMIHRTGISPEVSRARNYNWFSGLRVFVAALIVASIPAAAQSPDVKKLLTQIKAADAEQFAVSEEDGRFLRLLVVSSGAKRALEIGGAQGYSGIWIGLGLRETGGRLTTVEFDPQRAKVAAENVRKAGLSDVVTVVPGDAFAAIPKLEGEFDFVFLDAWKRDYKRFLDLVLPRLRPHGLFLAHNVVNKQAEMRDFLAAIQSDSRLATTIVKPSDEGMSVSVKLR